MRDEAYADGDAKLYVSIINTSLPVHIEKDCIATTKLEPHLHGFGLPCAKELLRRNNAFYTMDYGGHLFSTSGRYACGIKYDTHEGGKSMEMNSVMATEIVAAEVEHIVLPQIVSIKQASRMLGLPPYYLRRLCKEVPGVAFQSGIKWYINLGKLVDYYNNSGRNAAG